MNIFKFRKNVRFSNKDIILFMLPMLFEQLMVASLGTADTFMVSSLGEVAIAGVALVNRIDNFVKSFLVALAQGGSVVISQYIGAENEEMAQVSLKTNIRIVILIGFVTTVIMFAFKSLILKFLFGGAEADVLSVSKSYFTITAFSYSFVALYYACSASFRAMGESRIPFVASVIMMLINLLIKYIFIFKMHIGVKGAALSTLIAMALVGFVMLIMLYGRKNKIRLKGLLKRELNKDMAVRILNLSLPNGIEQAMFQLGVLAIAGLISGLGTASIAADSISRNIMPFLSSLGVAFNAVMMLIVGQCMGAGSPDEAEMYTKHILKLDYSLTLINSLMLLALSKPLISIFNVSPETENYAFRIIMIYSLGTIIMYPTSFAMAAALRGSGDTKFVMAVAILSMFILRIGMAYVFVYLFNLGVIGTWLAMVCDWAARSLIFAVRFKRGKWKKNKVI